MKYGSWTMGQTEALINKLGGIDQARKLLSCSEVTVEGNKESKAVIRCVSRLSCKISEAFLVHVNYDSSHQEQIRTCKVSFTHPGPMNLLWKNPGEHLVSVGCGETDLSVMLVHVNRPTTKEVLAEMDKLNFRPASSPETLAFLAAHPDVPRIFPVVGLGSVWVDSLGYRYILFACVDSNGRRLELRWCGGVLSVYCRFLAVPK